MEVHVHQNAKAINHILMHTENTFAFSSSMVSIRFEYQSFQFQDRTLLCVCVCVYIFAHVPCSQYDLCVCVCGPCASYSSCFCFIKTLLNFLVLQNEKQLWRLSLIHTSISSPFFLTHTTMPSASSCVPTHERISLNVAITL